MPRSQALTRRAAAVAFLPVVAGLGGCGFDYATDRINTIGAGVNARGDAVDVLGSVIVTNQDGVGLFAGTLVNDDDNEPATLTAVGVGGDEPLPVEPGREVPPGEFRNLFATGGVLVEGDLGAGDFVEVTLEFDTGQVTTLEVNVFPPCGVYSPANMTDLGLEQLPPTPDEADGPTAEDLEEVLAEDPDDGTSRNDLPGRYSCEDVEPVEPEEQVDSSGDGADPEPGEVAP